jgi:hypothetical protein
MGLICIHHCFFDLRNTKSVSSTRSATGVNGLRAFRRPSRTAVSGSMQTTVPSEERWLSAFSISQLKIEIEYFLISDILN